MSTPTPSAAVVICTRDRPDDLLLCLRSIQIQSVEPNEVIIVSGSQRSCPADIITQLPSLHINVIECYEHNISKSRNAGLKEAQSELVLFIDDDAQAHEGWVQAYIKAFARNAEAWAIGGDVFDSRNTPPSHEFSFGIISAMGKQIPVRSNPSTTPPRGYLSNVKGCNFGIRRQQVIDLRGFDPFFAFAFDETDLMMTIHRAGAEVVHESAAIVDHAHTPGHYRLKNSLDRDWQVEYASHTMFMLKHASGLNRVYGRFVIRRRLFKLALSGVLSMIRTKINPKSFIKILFAANRGIRDAHKVYNQQQE